VYVECLGEVAPIAVLVVFVEVAVLVELVVVVAPKSYVASVFPFVLVVVSLLIVVVSVDDAVVAVVAFREGVSVAQSDVVVPQLVVEVVGMLVLGWHY